MEETKGFSLQSMSESFFSIANEIVCVVVAAVLSFIICEIITFVIGLILKKSIKEEHRNIITKKLKGNIIGTVTIITAYIASTLSRTETQRHGFLVFLEITLYIVSILAVGFLVNKIFWLFKYFILASYSSRTDEHSLRKIQTQVLFIYRLITVVLWIVAISLILINFEGIRQLGTSLLASAGIIGVVAGFAAQKSISNLFAGFQIAFTQAIKIGDSVFVEGEGGMVEEITLTYVVVKLWDERRLVLPIIYFIEKPFQNWTKGSTQLIGYINFYVDYLTPIDVLREELRKILKKSQHWDGRICDLHVTDVTDKALVVRASVSADDAAKLWDLRCYVREEMMKYIKENSPEYLPQLRSAPASSK